MAKASRQKLKILYLLKALWEESDEDHPLSVRDMIEYLAGYGIAAERKSIYDDLELLGVFGLNIANRRKKPSGYYLADRRIRTDELRLIADAVTSAPYISEEKTMVLLKKLEEMAEISKRRNFWYHPQEKKTALALDEEIYERVDAIQRGMNTDCQIRFIYCEWTVEKKLKPRKNGDPYQVSPWGVIRKEGFYYMIGIDEKSHIVKHYRIDKMLEITFCETRRTGHEMFEHFDAGEFASRTFGMFGGNEETVTICFENRYIGVLIDRFGKDIRIIPKDKTHFHALLRIRVSPQFFGWLLGLGSGPEIVAPEAIRTEYQRFLKKALETYQ